jgi:hypothetical protein
MKNKLYGVNSLFLVTSNRLGGNRVLRFAFSQIPVFFNISFPMTWKKRIIEWVRSYLQLFINWTQTWATSKDHVTVQSISPTVFVKMFAIIHSAWPPPCQPSWSVLPSVFSLYSTQLLAYLTFDSIRSIWILFCQLDRLCWLQKESEQRSRKEEMKHKLYVVNSLFLVPSNRLGGNRAFSQQSKASLKSQTGFVEMFTFMS